MTEAQTQELLADYRASAARRAERVTELLREVDVKRRRAVLAEGRARDAEARIAQLERRLNRARAAATSTPQSPAASSLTRRVRRHVGSVRRLVRAR